MKTPLVSILMAVRDEERYLPSALDSIRRQTLSDWELVVVDDGSCDSTADILKIYSEKDTRIRPVFRRAEGLVPALRNGFHRCRSDLVARMDGDDICHPRRLEKQHRYLLENPDTTLVASNIRYFPARNVREGMRHYEKWQNSLADQELIERDMFVESPFTQPSVMFRKQAIESVGGYRDMGWAEDYDLWLRLAMTGHRFARLPETLFFWREHASRMTHTSGICSLESFRRCKASFLKQTYLRNTTAITLWGAGLEGKAWRKVLNEFGIRVRRWIDIDSKKIGQTIHQATVDSPGSLRPGCGPMLITIGTRGARRLVREKCGELGLTEGLDYICVT